MALLAGRPLLERLVKQVFALRASHNCFTSCVNKPVYIELPCDGSSVGLSGACHTYRLHLKAKFAGPENLQCCKSGIVGLQALDPVLNSACWSGPPNHTLPQLSRWCAATLLLCKEAAECKVELQGGVWGTLLG